MTLQSGAHLGSYEILSPLGSGGMGEVYRAHDTKLGRDVAIKVLPEALAADPDRIARFEREAKTLAALNHPNIAHIHGLEESDGIRALVMELVEGPTLADRIAGGPIPIDEALPIVKQIAEALEAAHEQGIIHRDLKPANVKVRDDGTVKVLDFGLAKALEPVGGSADPARLSMSPTIMSPAAMTGVGVLLGTAAYMAPEQAKGRPADKRSDIWAFGCVLYEILTAKRAFDGDDVSDILANVLRGVPDWTAIASNTPPSINRLLRRCLQKDPRQRLADAGSARLEIHDAEVLPPFESTRVAPTVMQSRLLWIVASIGVIAIAVAVLSTRRPAFPPLPLQVDLLTPPLLKDDGLGTYVQAGFALSPNGRQLAFVADAPRKIWLRSLDDGSTRVLDGTDGGAFPFWAPDGRSIGFSTWDGLKRLDLSDGAIRLLASAVVGAGGAATWNGDQIIYSETSVRPLFLVSATKKSDPVAVTTLATGETGHILPSFLPDGRHFLYQVRGTAETTGVYVRALDGGAPKRLIAADGGGVYLLDHLVFVRGGDLFAQRFDLKRLELTGEAFQVNTSQPGAAPSRVGVSASPAGTIAFRRIPTGVAAQLVWFDRAGNELGRIPDAGDFSHLALSRDGHRVAMRRLTNGRNVLWVFDLDRSAWARLTSEETSGSQPAWAPDGKRVAYFSTRQGNQNLYIRDAGAGGKEELVLTDSEVKKLNDWSPDGRYLIYSGPQKRLWAVLLEGARKPIALVQSHFGERDAQVSPDGRWIAYQSEESGRSEIYAQPFPGPGERIPITTTGGAEVRWRADGRELYYIALDGRLTAIPIEGLGDGSTLHPGVPVPLFLTHTPAGVVQPGGLRQPYVVSQDGQRFLIATLADWTVEPPLTLIVNWRPTP